MNQCSPLFNQFRTSWNSSVFVEMAANCTSFVKVQWKWQRFTTVLKSAACEWFLIFLLLIDAVFAYLLTKFAHYCKLQVPCILCSRLDHILGDENPGFYLNLLCSNHTSEISSLISCHIQGKLADGCGMCEECLLSFIMKTKSNPDMQRLLVGKFEIDHGTRGFQSLLLNRELVPGSVGMRLCSCCNKPWRSRQTSNRILRLKSPRSGMTKPNIPLPRHLTQRESLKKMGERFSGPLTSRPLVKCGYDPLPHVGYTQLKITSDSESDFPFSDDDGSSGIVHDMKQPTEESTNQHASEVPPKTLVNFIAPEKLIHYSSKPCMHPNIRKHLDLGDSSHDMSELNWQQADQKTYPCALPELISLDDFPSSSNVTEDLVGVSTSKCELKFPLPQNSDPSSLFEFMSPVDAPSSVKAVEGPVVASQRMSDSSGTGDIRDISMKKHEEILKSGTETTGAGIHTDQVANVVPPLNPTYVDLSYACKPIISSKEREAFNFMAETPPTKEPERGHEDFNMLPGENACNQGIDLSSDNTIPIMQCHGDELQIIDASRSNGVPMLQDSVFMERTESSGLESLDGSFVSEIEGESIVDRLKRQVEYDRRRINALYEELEEERSASAIAANQAMAMITRLQEEKAALNMEALQYLRMMEEQAEYDVEALEKANDHLAVKEKEIQDLESELELLKLKFDESVVQPEGSCDLEGKNMTSESTFICYAKEDVNVPPIAMFREVSNGSEKPAVKSSWSDYEDEKLFISQCLRGLERKIHQFAHHGAASYMSDSEYSEETSDRALNEGKSLYKEGTQINGEMKENSFLIQKDLMVYNGSLPGHLMSNASVGEDQIVGNENNHLAPIEQKSSKRHKETDLATLENELADLNERLEALESDFNFLDHTFNSLQNGKEGLQFVQEIAHHLQELRKIGMRSRCHSVP